MNGLNYKQLLYFWRAARDGGVQRASETLHVTPQAVSGQIRALEQYLGATLFSRQGRGLELTETGRQVADAADQIFALGQQLEESIRRMALPSGELRVGIGDMVPKPMAFHLLRPATELQPQPRLVCREGPLNELLGDLAVHALDLVIADRPLPNGISLRGFSHLLGQFPLAFFGTESCRAQYPGPFPACLDGAPILLPGSNSAIRPALRAWFTRHGIQPRIVGEFDDGALLTAFGREGMGFFPAAAVLESRMLSQYGARCIGQTDEISEQVYAITVERSLERLPALAAVLGASRPIGAAA